MVWYRKTAHATVPGWLDSGMEMCLCMSESGDSFICVAWRETREGWPLLTVETEMNGDSKSTMKGDLPWLVVGSLDSSCW